MAQQKKLGTKKLRAALDTPNVAQLQVLEFFVAEAVRLQDEIAAIEATLAERNAALNKITHEDITMQMQGVGITEFKTAAGLTVTVGDFVSGTLPKREEDGGEPGARQKALEWLSKNAGGIVKEEVSFSFSKGEQARSDKLKALLRKSGYEDFFAEVDVNYQTLAAFARERVRRGEKIPSIIGVFIDHKAKIKPPKESKSK